MSSYDNIKWAGRGAINGFIIGTLFKIYQDPLSDYPLSLAFLATLGAVMPAIVAYPLSRISPDTLRLFPPVAPYTSGFVAGLLAGFCITSAYAPSSRMRI